MKLLGVDLEATRPQSRARLAALARSLFLHRQPEATVQRRMGAEGEQNDDKEHRATRGQSAVGCGRDCTGEHSGKAGRFHAAAADRERSLYEAVAKGDKASFQSLVVPEGFWTTASGFVAVRLLAGGLEQFKLPQWSVDNVRVTWTDGNSALHADPKPDLGTAAECANEPYLRASSRKLNICAATSRALSTKG